MTDRATLTSIDSALRLLDREIWIITAADGPRRGGLLATWVSPASIDPERPVILAALGANHFTADLILSSKAFATHLLRPDQIELAWNFANGSGRTRDKLAGVAITENSFGVPRLTDCLAWFDCRVFASHSAGDRLLFWGDIVDGNHHLNAGGAASAPAILREQHFFSRLSPDQRQYLAADRAADAALGRPLLDAWRQSNDSRRSRE
jgi:flavin reductase (DIM6/NTAB) family NADH-FMN oxidoreductase RutF